MPDWCHSHHRALGGCMSPPPNSDEGVSRFCWIEIVKMFWNLYDILIKPLSVASIDNDKLNKIQLQVVRAL